MRYQSTTGLHRDDVTELCSRIHARPGRPQHQPQGSPDGPVQAGRDHLGPAGSEHVADGGGGLVRDLPAQRVTHLAPHAGPDGHRHHVHRYQLGAVPDPGPPRAGPRKSSSPQATGPPPARTRPATQADSTPRGLSVQAALGDLGLQELGLLPTDLTAHRSSPRARPRRWTPAGQQAQRNPGLLLCRDRCWPTYVRPSCRTCTTAPPPNLTRDRNARTPVAPPSHQRSGLMGQVRGMERTDRSDAECSGDSTWCDV